MEEGEADLVVDIQWVLEREDMMLKGPVGETPLFINKWGEMRSVEGNLMELLWGLKSF